MCLSEVVSLVGRGVGMRREMKLVEVVEVVVQNNLAVGGENPSWSSLRLI